MEMIPWTDIVGFHIFTMSATKMLVVMPNEPEKYIDSSSLVRRKLNKANYNIVGSPFPFPRPR